MWREQRNNALLSREPKVQRNSFFSAEEQQRTMAAPQPALSATGAFAAAQANHLEPITLQRVANGGYNVRFKGPVGSRAFLCVGDANARVDLGLVTHGINAPFKGDPYAELCALLRIIRQKGAWATPISCWITFEKNGAPAGSTNHQKLDAPVEPLEGMVTTRLLRSQSGKLGYSPKNAAGVHDGRVLTPFYLDGYRYFTHAFRFETVSSCRGFDCTTFPLALAFLEVVKQPGYGKQVSEQLFASMCGLEQLKPKEMFELWQNPIATRGSYIAFSSSHVVMVNNAVTHEFTDHSPAGYQTFPGAQHERWNATNLWWVRKLPPSWDSLLT